MAGFFGFFDYTKPGPGVDPDAPPKAPIVVFFEVLQRKFWNLVKINLMFNIFNIPALILGIFASLFVFQQMIVPGDVADPNMALSDLFNRFMLATILLCIPMITVGPAQAGFTYILRNYAREEHAFIWSDFKEHAAKNFKQSLAVCGIDFVVTVLMFLSLRFYILTNNGNLLMTVATVLMVIAFIVFMAMHIYIYPLMVTFKLTIKQLYKNALIFAMVKLLPNIGILLIAAILLVASLGFYPMIGLILYAFITVSLIGLITNFYAYRVIKKYMIPDETEEEEEEDEEETENEPAEDEAEAEVEAAEDEPQPEEDSSEVKRYY